MFPQTQQELRRYYGRASLSLLVYTLLVELATSLYLLPYYLGYYELFYSDWYAYVANAVVVYPAGVLAIGLMLRSFPTPKLVPGPTPSSGEIVSGAAIGVGMLYLGNLVTQLFLENTDTVDYANEAISQEPFLIAIVMTVIIGPVLEELIFRKLLLDRLLFLGDWSALLLSSLFFGLFHTNLYQFLYAITVGLVLGYIRIMTGRMRWNILLHMFINLFCGVLMDYLPDADWIWNALNVLILATMIYAIVYLIRKQPWRELYPGPTPCSGKEKWIACLTSPAFWVCVVLHLGLSVYYITM